MQVGDDCEDCAEVRVVIVCLLDLLLLDATTCCRMKYALRTMEA